MANGSTGPVAPCGTAAAARRRCRRNEPLDEACRQAARRDRGGNGTLSASRREIRNELPEFVPYVYRGTGDDTLTWWM